MAEKFWTHLKLKNGDQVKFVPPAPDGERLGGITQAQRESISELKNDIALQVAEITDHKTRIEKLETAESQSYIAGMNGSRMGYTQQMRKFFRLHHADDMTPAELTALCEDWYHGLRYGWDGQTVFKQPDVSTISEGVKTGDNAGMVCVPSTATEANRDDYAGLPLFACVDVNWICDDDGNIFVTAIDGVTSGFERYNPDKYVGVMQMTGWHYWYDEEKTYTEGYTDSRQIAEKYDHYTPLPQAVKLDGTVREFVVHGKYMAADVNGKMTCCAGLTPEGNISHDYLIDWSVKNGAGYSGGTVLDWSFLVLMTHIKYASLTQDNINQGCVNYDIRYSAAVSQTNTNRILLTEVQAASFIAGSSVLIGTNASSDRGTATTYSISGAKGFVIKAIENVTVDGSIYGALYFDERFDVTAGTTQVITWHYSSGYNDSVLGNDGSCVDSKNGKELAMIQGIEYSAGGYEVFADAILNEADEYYQPYTAELRKHQNKGSITANMKASGLLSLKLASSTWSYTRKEEYNGHIYFHTDTTAQSGIYTKDGFFKDASSFRGVRQWLCFGYLDSGPGFGGLSYLSGNSGLSHRYWAFLARLSPNGSRGEFVP